VFVQQGGVLVVQGGSLTGTVEGGSGALYGQNGDAFGSGLFIQGNQAVTLEGGAQPLVVASTIADQDGAWFSLGNLTPDPGTSSAGTTNAATGTLVIGSGVVQLGTAGTENTFAGPIVVDGGAALAITGDGALGTMNAGNAALGQNVLTLQAGSTLDLNAGFTLDHGIVVSGDPTFDVPLGAVDSIDTTISGGGNVVLSGGGTLVLQAANSYSGGSTLTAGSTLKLDGTYSAGSGTIQIDDASVLQSPSSGPTFGFPYPTVIAAPIAGFDGVLDCVGLPYTSAAISGSNDGVFYVTTGAGGMFFAEAAGFPTNGPFVLAPDTQGNTEVLTQTMTVSDDLGLNAAIREIDLATQGLAASAHASASFTIDLANSITLTNALTSDLTGVVLGNGSTLTIAGNGYTLDGGGIDRGLFAYQGVLNVDSLTIADAHAVGGAGGSGQSGGGGGAGVGGGLFVGASADVSLSGVSFASDAATGGAGGNYTAPPSSMAVGGAGGGGGLGGAGGNGLTTSTFGGGGGGVGRGATGGSGTQGGGAGILPGLPGGAPGVPSGGAGGSTVTPGGPSGGGGGAGYSGGGGGVGAKGTSPGFGGGGGYGAKGGFGGGGGAGTGSDGGKGGFGGSGAGFFASGGFGGGSARTSGGTTYTDAGGGGLGGGGDIFVQQGGTLVIAGGSLAAGTVAGGAGGIGQGLTAQSGAGFASGLFIQGTQDVTLAPAAGQTLVVDGAIGDQTGSDPGNVYNQPAAGTVVVDGLGTVVLAASNTFTGGVVLAGGTLDLATAGAAGRGAITFASDPLLQFAVANTPTNEIDHFFVGSTIEIEGFAATHSFYAGSTLTLTNGVGGTVDLHIPNLVLADVTIDPVSNTFVTTSQVMCFAAGTRLATQDGERPADTLQAGDRVVALDPHGRRSIETVRWVGRRVLDLAAHPDPVLAAPVRIRAGAIAPGIPARDVVVSPDHCVLIDDHLLRAFRLLNGVSVTQEFPRVITYVHIELDQHALLLAEGMPAESYLDEGFREFFDGALASPGPLHDRALIAACAPFAPDDAFAERIWRRVADRAGVGPPPPPAPPSVTVLAGGRALRPVGTKGDRCIFALPRDTRQVRLVSPAPRPADLRPWSEDRRRLGVSVRRIALDGARTMPLDGPALGRGWHAPEPGCRWTDGDAHLHLPAGTRLLELRLAG